MSTVWSFDSRAYAWDGHPLPQPTAWTVTATPLAGGSPVSHVLDAAGRAELGLDTGFWQVSASDGVTTLEYGYLQVKAGAQDPDGILIWTGVIPAGAVLDGVTLHDPTLSGTTTNTGTISGGIIDGVTLAGTNTNAGLLINTGTISGGVLSGVTLAGTTTNTGTISGGTLSGVTATNLNVTTGTIGAGVVIVNGGGIASAVQVVGVAVATSSSVAYADIPDLDITITTGTQLLVTLCSGFSMASHGAITIALKLDAGAEVGALPFADMADGTTDHWPVTLAYLFTGLTPGSHRVKGRWVVDVGNTVTAPASRRMIAQP